MLMRFALDLCGQKITATRSCTRAVCQVCYGEVVAKCGPLISWHWSHLSERNCDPWYEHLTPWHIAWQRYLYRYSNAEIEVPIERYKIRHRADAVLPNGQIVELQTSSISARDIYLREEFYGDKLLWVFDAREAYKSERFSFRKIDGDKRTFRWKQPRKSISLAKCKVVLDLGDGWLFSLKTIHFDKRCGGSGVLHIRPELDYVQKSTV